MQQPTPTHASLPGHQCRYIHRCWAKAEQGKEKCLGVQKAQALPVGKKNSQMTHEKFAEHF